MIVAGALLAFAPIGAAVGVGLSEGSNAAATGYWSYAGPLPAAVASKCHVSRNFVPAGSSLGPVEQRDLACVLRYLGDNGGGVTLTNP
jgi:hypothetical protein